MLFHPCRYLSYPVGPFSLIVCHKIIDLKKVSPLSNETKKVVSRYTPKTVPDSIPEPFSRCTHGHAIRPMKSN